MKIDFDVKATANAVVRAVKTQAKDDWAVIESYVRTQADLMAKQAAAIANGVAHGALKDDPDFLKTSSEDLAKETKAFAQEIVALAIVAFEKVWNATVKVLWGAINKVLASAGLGALALPVA